MRYFLPLARGMANHGGRRREVARPLFPSYVFIAGDGDVRYAAMATGRLCQVLEARNQARLRQQLLPIELSLNGGLAMESYPHAVVGTRCRISEGPLQGTEATIVNRDKLADVVLEVSVVGGAMLHVRVEQLEMLG